MNSRDGLFGFLGFDLPQLLLALYYIAICSVTLSSDLMQYRQEAYPAGIYGYLLKCGPYIFLQQLHNLIQLNYFLFSVRVTNLLYLIHSFPSTICVCFALLLKIKWLQLHGFFHGFPLLVHVCCTVFVAVTLQQNLKLDIGILLAVCILLKNALANSRSLVLS